MPDLGLKGSYKRQKNNASYNYSFETNTLHPLVQQIIILTHTHTHIYTHTHTHTYLFVY